MKYSIEVQLRGEWSTLKAAPKGGFTREKACEYIMVLRDNPSASVVSGPLKFRLQPVDVFDLEDL